MLRYRSDLPPLARRLRREMTDAERRLWSRLRRKQILGVTFLRQRLIGGFVVDFLAPRAGLVVEVDGGQHWEPRHHAADQERDRRLRELGFEVVRFSNLAVMRELDRVVEEIARFVDRGLRRRNPP